MIENGSGLCYTYSRMPAMMFRIAGRSRNFLCRRSAHCVTHLKLAARWSLLSDCCMVSYSYAFLLARCAAFERHSFVASCFSPASTRLASDP
jgi:hypothetical protein